VTDSKRLTLTALTLAAVLALTWGATASLAGSVVPWKTPQAMASKIRGLVPQIPTANTSAPSTITASTCHGVGKARTVAQGKTAVRKFTTFRCRATWARGKSTVWARSLAGGSFCASATGLAACPAGAPVAGDPRICHDPPAPAAGDPNRCARSAAEAALLRAMQANFADPNWRLGNVACDGANLAWKCTFKELDVFGIYYSSTIRFAKAKGAWTATFATSGGGGSSTCVAQPAPNTAGGKPSNWAAGPAPTCTR
jgi:hypothetical protein